MKTHPFTPLEGSIGPVCIDCGQIAIHGAHVESEKAPEGTAIAEHQEGEIHAIQMGDQRIEYTQMGESIPIVEQAIEVASMLPECEERTVLLARAARCLSTAMTYSGFLVTRGEGTTEAPDGHQADGQADG